MFVYKFKSTEKLLSEKDSKQVLTRKHFMQSLILIIDEIFLPMATSSFATVSEKYGIVDYQSMHGRID